MAEKIYVGKARYIETRYGELCKIWLTPEGIEAINANVDGKGGINLNMNEMKEPDRAGNTHYLTVDDWKPSRNEGGHRHGPQRRSTDGDSRRGPERDTGRNDNRGPSRRDDGGFGSYADPGQGNGGHRYSEADRNPPAGPNAETVSPEPFPEQDIEHGPQTGPDDFSDLVDDDIPF